MYKGWTTPEVVPIYLFFIADKKKKKQVWTISWRRMSNQIKGVDVDGVWYEDRELRLEDCLQNYSQSYLIIRLG